MNKTPLTVGELHEALNRLYLLPDLVGPIPEEINALLRGLLHERDCAARRVARFLKDVVG